MRPFDIGGLAIVDVVARLAVPGALAAVAHGAGNYALGAALTVTSLALLRGLWTGRAVERSFRDLWGAIVREAGRRSVVCLKSRPKEQAVAVLLSAAHDVARFRASVLPRALANGIGLLAVGGLLVWRLGMATAALAFGGLALLAALAGLIQLRLRRARVFSWDRFGVVARDVGALLDAAAELRAHGRQSSFMASLLLELRAMARAERQASTYGALLGLFPMGIGLVVLAIPLRGELGPLADLARLRGAAEAGLLGATALVLAVGLLQSAEEATQSAPCRRTIAGFLKPPPEDGSAVAGDGPLGKEAGDGVEPRRRASLVLREAEIELSRVSIVYRGSSSRTPAAVTHRWGPAEGLALLGDNGAGKSSLALAILGLLPIAEGELRFDGVAVSELDWAALRGEIAYLPQQPFVEPGASIGWHIRLLAGDGVSDAEIEAALERVGVLSVLTERAARAGVGVLELLAGELSGGQLRRVQLARIFVGDPELVVLDEPEAGLDAAGRRWLRALVTRLAPERRILLIAHDPGIVPEAFQTLECRALHGPA